ncbi:MAG: hypothetical protein ABJF04_06225 [Reichenbachiella sp.]|uniref:hypothetical protein n=1 Tax=Reichenbachiella sp. TaxID=2184521 RepID=UPI0032667D58
MSEKYKFRDPEGLYFVTCTIVHWIGLFTRKEFKHIIVDSLKYCQNLVENEITDEPEWYLYSSARDYAGKMGLLAVELLH